jgi:uncharacterized protein (TIGR02145 family)
MYVNYFSINAQPIDTIIDPRDGQVYKIVQIGEQWWMAENLSAISYSDGTPLVNGTGAGDITGDLTTKYYFWFNDDSSTYAGTYGALYTWAAAMNDAESTIDNPSNVLGVCPTGWHLPSDNEWKELEMFLGMSQEDADIQGYRGTDEGGKLKESGYDHWLYPNLGSTNSSGFNALPGSGRGGFIGYNALWWTATEYSNIQAWSRSLLYESSFITRYEEYKFNAYSIRCVKNFEKVVPPTIFINYISNITDSSALVESKITMHGGSKIISKGVCWNTMSNPTTENSLTDEGTDIGIFISSIKDLSPDTKYYIRAYASNIAGTSYSKEFVFITDSLIENPIDSITDIDGNIYPTVKIGNQIWMTKNLTVTKYNEGTLIPIINDNTEWTNLNYGAYSDYNNDTNLSAEYGRLYNFYVADNPLNVCPIGWHIPTHEEWITLVEYLGGENIAGGKLKESGFTHWRSPNTGATNATGFTALPGGYRSALSGAYSYLMDGGYYWSSTSVGISNEFGWGRYFFYQYQDASAFTSDKNTGNSIRCLKSNCNIQIYDSIIGTSCHQTSDGEIILTVVGGNPPYDILWSNGDTTTTCTNLSAGTYSAVIYDINKCTTFYSGTITEPDTIKVNGITGPSQVIENETAAYSVENKVNTIYEWIITGGDIISGQGTNLVNILWGTANTCTVSVIVSDLNYCYSDSAQIEVNIVETGFGKTKENELTIYPNPLSDQTIIKFNNPEGSQYKLYIMDLSGKVCRIVDDITTSEYVLEKGDLKQGFYFIELRGSNIFRGKIIVE